MAQKKQTDDELHRVLLEDMESLGNKQRGKGTNLDLDEGDEKAMEKLYPSSEQARSDNSKKK